MRWLMIILLITSACGTTDRAQRQLRKSKQHLAKAIALGAEVKSDTVYVSRDVIVPAYQVDTLLQVKNLHDTIRVETERIKVKIKIDTLEQTVYVDANCKADTVRIEVPVKVENEVSAGYSLWDLIILAIVVFAVGVLLSPLVKKIIK